MKKSIYKIFVSAVLVLILTVNASAFAPLVVAGMYLTGSLVIHVAAVAGIYYAMTTGGTSTVAATTGEISRPSKVTWVDLTLPTPAVVEKNITAKLPAATAKSMANAAPSTYPNIKAASSYTVPAFYGPSTPLPADPTGMVGQKVYTAYQNTYWVLDSFAGNVVGSNPSSPNWNIAYFNGSQVGIYNGPNGSNSNWAKYNAHSVSAPAANQPQPATDAQFATNIANNGVSGAVKTAMQSEIDKMINDSSYVPTFTDDSTGLPFAPPASTSVAEPSKVAAYNNNQTAAETASAAGTAAAAATRAAWLNYSGNKGAGTYAQYQAAVAGQAATAAGTARNAATDANNAADTAAAVPSSGAAKTFSTAKFSQLKGALTSTYPFSTINTIGTYYSLLSSGSNTAPVFSLPLPMSHTMTVDLSIFDPVATTIRYLFGILFTAGCGWYVVRFWRGVA